MRPFVDLTLLIIFGVFLAGCGGGSSDSATTSPTANDPFYSYGWHLHAPEKEFADQYGILPDAGIHIEKAWERTLGEDVVVAILDDYFEPTHPDIADNVILTYNARTGGTDVSAPDGYEPHGQWCSGIVAAVSNTTGVVGVAPKAKLILVGNAYNSDADTIRAFAYAMEHGADVISCSWGSYTVSQAVSDIIRTAYEQNITVVFAAGNQDYNLDNPFIDDESELPWVIGVTASSEINDRTSYANYGSAIDLMAPGGERIGLPTTDLTGPEGMSPYESYDSRTWLGEDYNFFRGTSASAPVVSGVAALLKSQDPSRTPDRIRSILIETADKIGTDPYDENGFEIRHLYGKVNAERALEAGALAAE